MNQMEQRIILREMGGHRILRVVFLWNAAGQRYEIVFVHPGSCGQCRANRQWGGYLPENG
jgi:hypothetical protein